MSLRKSLFIGAWSLTAIGLAGGTAYAGIDIGISINVAPPELPVYEQPAMPGDGYLWSPGYWAWGGEDYYWVPGTWVQAPRPGFLWTPGYWGWGEGAYLWHGGYWGEHVGFYGGVNYGFGYVGSGYAGGEWRGGNFFYNRSVNNIPSSVHVTNVYNRTVVNNITVSRVSFNGGTGGVAARPTPQELSAEHENHLPPVAAQQRNSEAARADPAFHTATNHGAPAVAATAHAGTFHGAGVVAAHGATAVAPHPAAHAATAPAGAHPNAPVESHANAVVEHPNSAQPQAHAFRPDTPNGGAGAAHAPPTPQAQHEAPPAPHAAPEAHDEHEHEHDK